MLRKKILLLFSLFFLLTSCGRTEKEGEDAVFSETAFYNGILYFFNREQETICAFDGKQVETLSFPVAVGKFAIYKNYLYAQCRLGYASFDLKEDALSRVYEFQRAGGVDLLTEGKIHNGFHSLDLQTGELAHSLLTRMFSWYDSADGKIYALDNRRIYELVGDRAFIPIADLSDYLEPSRTVLAKTSFALYAGNSVAQYQVELKTGTISLLEGGRFQGEWGGRLYFSRETSRRQFNTYAELFSQKENGRGKELVSQSFLLEGSQVFNDYGEMAGPYWLVSTLTKAEFPVARDFSEPPGGDEKYRILYTYVFDFREEEWYLLMQQRTDKTYA